MFKKQKRPDGTTTQSSASSMSTSREQLEQSTRRLQGCYEVTKYANANNAVLLQHLNTVINAVGALADDMSKQLAFNSQQQLIATEIYLSSISTDNRLKLQAILTSKNLLTVKWSLVLDLIEEENDPNVQADYLTAAMCIASHPFYFKLGETDIPQIDWSKGLTMSDSAYHQATGEINAILMLVDDVMQMHYPTEKERIKYLLRIVFRQPRRRDKTLMLIRAHPSHYTSNSGEIDAVERLKLEIWEDILNRMEDAGLVPAKPNTPADPQIEALAKRFSVEGSV